MFKLAEYAALKWLSVSALVLVADIVTKWLALRHLLLHDAVPVFKYFNLTLVYNEGAAFSLLSHEQGWQRWFLSFVAVVVSIMILVWLKQSARAPMVHKIALSLILGGALGNLLDRLRFGYVIDFLDFHIGAWHFPAFNIADSAITCGAILLLLTLWCKGDHENSTR